VSARRPCGKCKWTGSCPCSYLPSSSRADVVKHAAHCKGMQPRTHESVMAEVEHLRTISTKTARAKFSTETGIFSPFFASEYILRDVVIDTTIDVMHVFFCGATRYLLSWVTDEIIPRDFTWAQLNAAKRAFPWRRNQRVPDLERSKGDKRASCSIHLNAAEMMDFAIARWRPRAPPPTRAHTIATPRPSAAPH